MSTERNPIQIVTGTIDFYNYKKNLGVVVLDDGQRVQIYERNSCTVTGTADDFTLTEEHGENFPHTKKNDVSRIVMRICQRFGHPYVIGWGVVPYRHAPIHSMWQAVLIDYIGGICNVVAIPGKRVLVSGRLKSFRFSDNILALTIDISSQTNGDAIEKVVWEHFVAPASVFHKPDPNRRLFIVLEGEAERIRLSFDLPV